MAEKVWWEPKVACYILATVAGFSLSNYISAEEVCDWTGKREAELRVAEKEGACQRRGQARWLWTHGIYQPQVAMISQG